MNETKLSIGLTVEQTNLCLEALGQLPFVRVYSVIAQIQEQARAQISAANAAARADEQEESHE